MNIEYNIEHFESEAWDNYEYCLEAVRRNGYNIKYVRNQSLELCLEAVKEEEHALRYVKEQTPELIHLMRKNNIGIWQEHLNNITQEQIDEYYEQNPHLLLTL